MGAIYTDLRPAPVYELRWWGPLFNLTEEGALHLR